MEPLRRSVRNQPHRKKVRDNTAVAGLVTDKNEMAAAVVDGKNDIELLQVNAPPYRCAMRRLTS